MARCTPVAPFIDDEPFDQDDQADDTAAWYVEVEYWRDGGDVDGFYKRVGPFGSAVAAARAASVIRNLIECVADDAADDGR